MTESMTEDRGQNAATWRPHPHLNTRTRYPTAETWDLKMNHPSQSSGFRAPLEFYLPATSHLRLPPATRNEIVLLTYTTPTN